MTKYWAKRFKNIILTGMPATGKSSFGKLYAQHSERLFLDFDSYLESTVKKTIPQIFEEEGEDGFRALEEKILYKLERRHNYVISMGGGTLQKPDSISFARRLGLIVSLYTHPKELAKRIFDRILENKETRPLFSKAQTIEETENIINQLWEKRKSFYEKSDVFIDTTYNTMDTLKLHLAYIEKRASNREYMQEVYNILNRGNRPQSKWSEKEEDPPPFIEKENTI